MTKIILDQFEQYLEKNIERFQTLDTSHPARSIVGKNSPIKESRKQISIKIRNSDLEVLKEKAQQDSIPYQTLLNTIIHNYSIKIQKKKLSS